MQNVLTKVEGDAASTNDQEEVDLGIEFPLRFSDPQVPKIESVEFKTNAVSPFHYID
jgi:hypothetical protein